MEKILIGIADDQNLFRQGLGNLIKTRPDLELVVEAPDGKQLLDRLKHLPVLPHVVITDLNMPEVNGAELNRLLQLQYPSIKVIVLSIYKVERYMSRVIAEGACGYLVKDCKEEELYKAIVMVHKTGFYLDEMILAVMKQGLSRPSGPITNINNISIRLTTREEQILKMICREYTNAEIAAELFLSPRTVDGHRNNLLDKTGCRNTAGLVIFAIKSGIYELIF